MNYFNTLTWDKCHLVFLNHSKSDFEPPLNWVAGNSMSPGVAQGSNGEGMTEAIGWLEIHSPAQDRCWGPSRGRTSTPGVQCPQKHHSTTRLGPCEGLWSQSL